MEKVVTDHVMTKVRQKRTKGVGMLWHYIHITHYVELTATPPSHETIGAGSISRRIKNSTSILLVPSYMILDLRTGHLSSSEEIR